MILVKFYCHYYFLIGKIFVFLHPKFTFFAVPYYGQPHTPQMYGAAGLRPGAGPPGTLPMKTGSYHQAYPQSQPGYSAHNYQEGYQAMHPGVATQMYQQQVIFAFACIFSVTLYTD